MTERRHNREVLVAVALRDGGRERLPQEFAADEILIVTSPDGDRSWLEEGASLKAVAAFGLPVSRVVVTARGTADASDTATEQ